MRHIRESVMNMAKLFIGKFKTIDTAPLWKKIKKNKTLTVKPSDEVIQFLKELKKDPNKALLLETMKDTKFIVKYYRSKTYEPLRKGMYYIYLPRPYKITIGGFRKEEDIQTEIKRLAQLYGHVNTCRLVVTGDLHEVLEDL